MTHTDDAAIAQWHRNKYSIYADLGIGGLFFVLAKLTDDLALSALVTAAAGLGLVVVQRFVRVDLLGGLAMFGVVVLLLSAGFSYAFDSDWAVKLKSTFLGCDRRPDVRRRLLRGRRYFGLRLGRYMPQPIDPQRLALGMGMLGLVMAGLNALVAVFMSKDVWLYYTTFGDVIVSMLLVFAVLRYALARGSAWVSGRVARCSPPAVSSAARCWSVSASSRSRRTGWRCGRMRRPGSSRPGSGSRRRRSRRDRAACGPGPGYAHALAMLLAEELDADWAQVRVEEAPRPTITRTGTCFAASWAARCSCRACSIAAPTGRRSS
ncbi:MAG: hypothetical protein R3E65_04410 [Steroidobacteraceae bacterium]